MKVIVLLLTGGIHHTCVCTHDYLKSIPISRNFNITLMHTHTTRLASTNTTVVCTTEDFPINMITRTKVTRTIRTLLLKYVTHLHV